MEAKKLEDNHEEWELPIPAWKGAFLDYSNPDKFYSLNEGTPYTHDDVAICEVAIFSGPLFTERHPKGIPSAYCSCGFYALKDRTQLQTSMYSAPTSGLTRVVLNVELYGKILVGSEGYRAEKQRVMAVYGHKPNHRRCQFERYGPLDQLPQTPGTELISPDVTFTAEGWRDSTGRLTTFPTIPQFRAKCTNTATCRDTETNSVFCQFHTPPPNRRDFIVNPKPELPGGVEFHWLEETEWYMQMRRN
jgi:hypothetical protein